MEKVTQLLCTASFALGLVLVPALVAEAGRPRGHCCPPPCYRPYSPDHAAPTDAPPSDEAPAPDTDTDPTDDQTPDQPEQQLDLSQRAPTSAAAPTASLAGGTSTSVIGRLDQNNRFNLFDSMSAVPRDRVWYSFQYAEGYNLSLDSSGGFGTRMNQMISRIGAEARLADDFSVAVQGQYSDPEDAFTSGFNDNWSNPQVALKYVIGEDCDSVYSVILGANLQSHIDSQDIDENTTRLMPGFLAYEETFSDAFFHYGFQFGLPTDGNIPYTFDWVLGTGYWLCRDNGCGGCGSCCGSSCGSCCGDYGCGSCCGSSCGGCGSCCGGCDSCCGSSCGCGGGCGDTGLVLQVELLGKHVIDDATTGDAFFTTADFEEERHVFDATGGVTAYLGDGVAVAMGYSFPISGNEARRGEFITTLSYEF
jgi:hypothetical protein